MASTIRIKRSGVSGNPNTLAAGELAYSSLGGTQSNGGDRLYVGMGAETMGNAANHFVIGGKYFTDMLDHVAGTLTANSGIIVDSNSKIDVLNVDNITINENDISSTNLNGNITFTPNGNGAVIVNTGHELKVTDLTTKRVVFVGNNGALIDNNNFAFDSASQTLSVTGSFVIDNITLDGNVISSNNNNGNIDLTPNGTGDVRVSANHYLLVQDTTNAITTTSGALQVAGGLGIGKNIYVGGDVTAQVINGTQLNIDNLRIDGNILSSQNVNGNVTISPNGIGNVEITTGSYLLVSDITNASSTVTGALQVAGGIAVAKDVFVAGVGQFKSNITVDGTATANNAANATSTVTGALQVVGGVGIGRDIYVGGNITAQVIDGTQLNIDNLRLDGNVISSTNNNGNVDLTPNGTGDVRITSGHYLLVKDSTQSISTSTGALQVTGGVGIARDIFVGGEITGSKLNIDDISINGNTVTNVTLNSDLFLKTTGTGKINVNGYFTFPNYTGTASYVLTSNGSGDTNWMPSSSVLNFTGDTGGPDSVDLLTETLTISGGEGIDTSITNNTITISGEDASDSNKGIAKFSAGYFTTTNGDVSILNATSSTVGIASFNVGDFVVSNGEVTLLVERIEDLAGTMFSGNSSINISSTYNDSTGKVDQVVNTATTSVLGVASFDSGDFSVTAGAVSIKAEGVANSQLEKSSITVGSTLFSLGSTSTTLAGLTEVTVGNVKVSDHTIEAVNTGTIHINSTVSVSFNNVQLKNVANPIDDQDVATKYYVDNVAQGLHTHFAVQAATSATLASIIGGSVTYTTVTNGVGDYLTLSSPLTMLDNYSLSNGDRILVKSETNTNYNGIYVRTNSTTLTRAQDFDEVVEVAGGDFVFVVHGQLYGDTGWVQTEETTGIGTSPIVWTQFSGAGTYIAGSGLNIAGNEFSVNVSNGITIINDEVQLDAAVAGDGLTYSAGVINVVGTADRISVNTNSIDISVGYIGQTSITTLGTVTSGTWNASILSSSYGGTGYSSYSAYDLLVGNIGGSLSKLTLGSAGKVLQVNSLGTALEYNDIDGGTY